MKNVSTGIYVRVSTEEQAQEGFSIRAQTEKLKAYALLKEWDIFEIYADEGISGKNIVDRPAINRLIDDIENGKVNNVLVFKVDRLTRNTKNLLELIELFENYNCSFNSLTESIDTQTASGRMFLKIIGIFAEFERENIVERVKVGMERKVKEGYTLANGIISYGYTKEKGQKVQTINLEETNIVKEIFSMFVDKNMAMTRIAKTLSERKVLTKTKITSWTVTTIKQILTNPTYIGKVRYSINNEEKYFEIDGHHERILSDEMFYLAQEKIKNIPHTNRTKKPKEQSYFCGVLYCGMCSGKFSTHNNVNILVNGHKKPCITYRCYQKVRFCDNRCKSPDIGHSKIETAFLEYINNINDITEDVDINIEENAKKAEQELIKSIADCEKKIDVLQNRKNQAIEQYMQGVIEFDEYKKMIKAFNENYEVLETQLQNTKTELSTVIAIPEVLPEDVITNIKQNWEHLSDNEKMIFLQRFIKKITITVEKIHKRNNAVKINSIEFHSGELPQKDKVRSRLR